MTTEIIVGGTFKIRPYGNGPCFVITRKIVTRNQTVRWGKNKYQRTLKDAFHAIRKYYVHEEMYSNKKDEIIEDAERFEEVLGKFENSLSEVEVRNSEYLDDELGIFAPEEEGEV